MSYKATLQDITSRDYLIEYPLTASSGVEKADISERLDSLFFVWVRRNLLNGSLFYRNLSPLLEIDLSSVYSQFELKIETYTAKLLSEEDIVSAMLKQDFIVRMPPVREYTVWVKVKRVEKATPRIVEPEVL